MIGKCHNYSLLHEASPEASVQFRRIVLYVSPKGHCSAFLVNTTIYLTFRTWEDSLFNSAFCLVVDKSSETSHLKHLGGRQGAFGEQGFADSIF